MTDFDFIPISATAENLERIANMDILTDKIETEDDNALVTAASLFKTVSLNGKKGSFSVWQPNTEYKVGDMVIADNAVVVYYDDIQGEEHSYGCNESVIAECVTEHTSADVFKEVDETDPFNPIQLWEVYSIKSVRNGKEGYLDNAFDISLFATRNEVKEYVGEIDTALDAIINIQNSILGFPEAEETTF